MNQNLSGIDFKGLVIQLGELVHKCDQADMQLRTIIGVLNVDEITGDAATIQMVEFLPLLSEINIPVMNEENSSNVLAFAPMVHRNISTLATMLENVRYNPQTHLTQHIAEVFARLRLLYAAQKEAIRVVFMNRFRIIKSINDSAAKNADMFDKITHHSLQAATMTAEVGNAAILKAKSLHNDLRIIAEA